MRSERWTILCRILAISVGLCVGAARGAEVIEHLQSDMQVAVDGSMQVVETITVNAQGEKFKRGIYRDFPTTYRDRFNHRVQVRFEVLGVRRNGAPEPWFIKRLTNGQRVYIGDKDVLINKGRHSYEITYRTDRQLGFFEDHDELYWNATGNGWGVPIEKAVAYVYLPKSVPNSEISGEAYTGFTGQKGTDYESGVDDEGVLWFRTTRVLRASEGLTIVASWPKAHVHEPTSRERAKWLLQDNGRLLAGILGALLLLVYYLLFWLRVGRDPQAGVIVTLYEPPRKHSPASMRFVQRMGYDAKTFTAALVNLAAKGHLHINHEADGFVIERAQSEKTLAPGERALLKALLGSRNSQRIERQFHSIISKAMDAHKTRLEADYESTHFVTNLLPTGGGIAISILVLLSAMFWPQAGPDWGGEISAGVFVSVWLGVWSFGVFMLLSKAVAAWREARVGGRYLKAVFLTLFSIPFVGGWFMGANMLSETTSLGIVALLASLIGLNFLFYHLMKAPTVLGRAMLDEIEGFREYLALAEGDELRLRNPPQRTPALFESLLPFAIALDVEDVWGARFVSVLATARREDGYEGPGWYSGRASEQLFDSNAFANDVGGALASSISSSSQAPGSSSGSGGGGSSGGGGGGGGGGGW